MAVVNSKPGKDAAQYLARRTKKETGLPRKMKNGKTPRKFGSGPGGRFRWKERPSESATGPLTPQRGRGKAQTLWLLVRLREKGERRGERQARDTLLKLPGHLWRAIPPKKKKKTPPHINPSDTGKKIRGGGRAARNYREAGRRRQEGEKVGRTCRAQSADLDRFKRAERRATRRKRKRGAHRVAP